MADPYAEFQNPASDPYSAFQDPAKAPQRTWADTAVDFGKGVLKGIGETARNWQNIENFGAGSAGMDNPFPKGSKGAGTYGKVQAGARDFESNYDKRLQARNTAQSLGKGTEAVAEAFVPIPGLEGMNAAVKGSRLLRNAPKLVKTGAGVAAQEGVRGTVLGFNKTGSVKEGAEQGAAAAVAAPLAGVLSTATGKMLNKSAQKLYQRFLIPGGGPNYNKSVAKNAAAELIKQGEFAMTKGGFTRRVEQNLMDAEHQIQQVENSAQGTSINVRPVLRKLQKALQDDTIQGQRIQGYQSVAKERRRLLKQVYSLSGASGRINAQDAVKLRRSWDELLNWERTEGTALKPGVKLAYQDATNALRHEINEQIPGMREANAKYSFYAGLNKVLKDKENATVGHRAHGLIGGLSMASGALYGTYQHNAEEAIALPILIGAAHSIMSSGANLTGSAIALDRVGSALQNGNVVAAVNRLATAASGAAIRHTGQPAQDAQ